MTARELELEARVRQLEVEKERLEIALSTQLELRNHGSPTTYPPQETDAWIAEHYDTKGAPGWVRQRRSVWGRGKETPDRDTVERVVRALGGDPSDVPEPAEILAGAEAAT